MVAIERQSESEWERK